MSRIDNYKLLVGNPGKGKRAPPPEGGDYIEPGNGGLDKVRHYAPDSQPYEDTDKTKMRLYNLKGKVNKPINSSQPRVWTYDLWTPTDLWQDFWEVHSGGGETEKFQVIKGNNKLPKLLLSIQIWQVTLWL